MNIDHASADEVKVFTVEYFVDNVAPFVNDVIVQNMDWRQLREWLLNHNAPFKKLSKRRRSQVCRAILATTNNTTPSAPETTTLSTRQMLLVGTNDREHQGLAECREASDRPPSMDDAAMATYGSEHDYGSEHEQEHEQSMGYEQGSEGGFDEEYDDDGAFADDYEHDGDDHDEDARLLNMNITLKNLPTSVHWSLVGVSDHIIRKANTLTHY